MANLELAYCKERLSTCQRELNKHQTDKAILESAHPLQRLPQSIADTVAEITALTGLIRHYKERVQALEDDDDVPLNTFLASARVGHSKRRVEEMAAAAADDDDDLPIGRPRSVPAPTDWVLHTARGIMQNVGVRLVAVANNANQSIRLAFEQRAPGSEPNYCVITKDTPNSVRVKFLVGPENFRLVSKETNVKLTYRDARHIQFLNENTGKQKTYDVGLDLLLYRERLILVASDD